MTPRRRKEENKDLPRGLSVNGKYFRFKNRLTGKTVSWAIPRKEAIKAAELANAAIDQYLAERWRHQILEPLSGMAFREVMEAHRRERLATRVNINTQSTLVAIYHTITRAPFVDRPIGDITIADLDTWMREQTPHQYRRIRTELVGIWDLAVRRGWQHHRDGNIANLTEMIAAPKSQRHRLPEADMYRIIAEASPHLRLAVYIMLQTTCRPCDVVFMRRDEFHGNAIRTKIRKSERDLDPTTAKYREFTLPDDAAAEIRRMYQDGVASPFIVHKRTGITKKLARGYEHWSQCTVDLISREFSAIRDRLGLWDHIENKRQRPSLYECRALAGHMMAKEGYSDEEIQERMAHSDAETTQIYTGRHEEFKPQYVPVKAGLKVDFGG